MAKQFPGASKSKAGGTKMTRARSFSCNAALWNRFPRREILVATFKNNFFHGQNRSGRRKNSSNMTGARILRRRRNSIEDGRQNRCAVTTSHLFRPNEPRTRRFLLPIWRPNPDFLGGKYSERAKRGGGGFGQAQQSKVLDRKALTEFYSKYGLPYPALVLSKKGAQRKPEPSANTLSREFTANYR
jgi:hypothetical protein